MPDPEHPLLAAFEEVPESPVSAGIVDVLGHNSNGCLHVDPSHDREAVSGVDVPIGVGQLQGTLALKAKRMSFVSLHDCRIPGECPAAGRPIIEVPVANQRVVPAGFKGHIVEMTPATGRRLHPESRGPGDDRQRLGGICG